MGATTRKILGSLAVCVATLVVSAVPAASQKGRQPVQSAGAEVEIVNGSRTRIDVLNVSPVTSDNWGRDLLGDATLAPGRRFTVRLLPNECRYDVRVVYQDSREEERRNLDLCRSGELVFTGQNARQAQGQQQQQQRPPAQQQTRNGDFALINRSRQRIDVINVSPVTDDNWGRDLLGNDTLAPGRRFNVRVGQRTDCRFDLRVIYQNGWEEEQRNVDVCDVGEVAFTGENAREPQQNQQNQQQRGADRGQGAPGNQAPPQRPAQRPPQQGEQQQQQAGQGQRPPPGTLMSTGTGFYITREGHILTNRHVIEGCGAVAIARPNGTRLPLRVVAEDAVNDLAVLQLANTTSPLLTFRTLATPIRAGDKVVVIGYPVRQLLGEVNVTEGSVSAVRGPRGDGTLFQITAPVQGGNSGGPILDESGLVVGVVVARVENLPGGRPAQNINFGIQLEVARRFVQSLGVTLTESGSQEARRTSDIAERAQPAVLPLDCLS